MASKIQSHTFYAAITPYTVDGSSADEFNELSVMSAYDNRHKHFYVSLHAGWSTGWGGHGCVLMGADNPLTGPKYVVIKSSPKNSQKFIDGMYANLEQAKAAIAWLFDKRDWKRLYTTVYKVAIDGYTEQYRKEMDELMAPAKEESKSEDSPMMKQYRDLKSKHPDAVLLFRCGDFYETYEDDAKVCADILGITLTKSTKTGVRMAGFPHHALDTYLPKLIRAGKRVAICDQLEDPKLTKKLVKRGITELVSPATNNESSNNQEDENMRLNISNQKNESKNVQNNAQVINEAIESVSVGEVSLNDIQPAVIVAEEPKSEEKPAVTVPLGDHGTLVVGGVPKTTKSGKPSDRFDLKKDPVTLKPKVTLKRKQPQVKTTQPVSPQPSALTTVRLITYKTKKGADAPLIVGFSGEDDPRWKRHFDAKPKWVSAGFRRDMEGNKACHLMFGTRYMDVAKALCDAYNTSDREAWAKAEQACADNYSGIVAGYQAEKAARKAEREAAKAAKATENPAQPAMSTEEKAMFNLFKKFMAGDPDAISAMNEAMKAA